MMLENDGEMHDHGAAGRLCPICPGKRLNARRGRDDTVKMKKRYHFGSAGVVNLVTTLSAVFAGNNLYK